MTPTCEFCGEEFMVTTATEEILANTEGAEEFVELLAGLMPDVPAHYDIQVGLCPRCNVRIILGPTMTITGEVVEDPENPEN